MAAALPFISASVPAVSRTQGPIERISSARSSWQRDWAKANLHGLMNLMLPSFLADGTTLDEDGIRHDVNHAVAQGFSGTMPMINWTPTGDARWKQFYRIVLDESRKRLPVHGIVFGPSPDYDLGVLRELEALGVDLILLASTYDRTSSVSQLYDSMAARITATQLPVMLYAATGSRAFPHLGPAGQPLDVYDRIADLANVVAVKVSQPVTLTSTMQLCARLGDRLLIGPVNLDFVPLLARHYPIRWSGQWNAEAVQTPGDQLGNQLLMACAAQKFDDAGQIATRMQPVLDHFYNVQADVLRKGAHPWQHNKYYSWLGGGNGGLLPVDRHAPKGAVPVLTASDRAKMRAAFAASGLTATTDPEEQFIVGRAQWAQGIRRSDLLDLPYYSAD